MNKVTDNFTTSRVIKVFLFPPQELLGMMSEEPLSYYPIFCYITIQQKTEVQV